MQTPRSAASSLHAWGANVTAIGRDSKQPIHKWKCFYETPQSAKDAQGLPWRDAIGVGVLNGINDWRTFDIDKCPGSATVDTLLQALGLPADYRWVWRSGSGTGWEVAFLCHDELPSGVLTGKDKEPGVFWGLPKDDASFDHIELRWDRCQTIYPPSQYEDATKPGYKWRGEAPDSPPSVVSVGHVLAAFFAVAILKPAEPKTAPKAKHQDAPSRPASDRDAIDGIKRRFDLVAYASKHWPGETQQERNGEIRICGHGGLLINEDEGIWDCFGWGAGGDAIELIGYRLYEGRWDRSDGTMFRAALEEGARETGVELPPLQQSNGGRFNIDQVEPVAGSDDVVTLRRADYEQLRRRAAEADRLDGWREWAMKVAQIETKKLSPAAKVVAFTLWPEMQSRKEHGVDEPKRVYIEEASKRAGLSPGTFGAKLKELDTVGAIGRTPARQANGRKKVLIQPESFYQPEAWEPPAPRDHGGHHPKAERPAPACPHPECTPETPFDEEVSTIARLVCTEHGEFHVTPERLTRRTWRIDAATGTWKPTKFVPLLPEKEANTQIAGYREDGSPSPYHASCPLADEPDPNTQIAGRSDPSPAPALAVPPSQQPILPSRYKRLAAQRAIGSLPDDLM